ncbi:MAG: rhodanese-like domain-containing protein [Alphaproteobacteria bacterium]|nr:rhodanese-like domain-containing protein [Alphaproteobacteria bacterium]
MYLPGDITETTCEDNNRCHGYAGDVNVNAAWKLLEKNAEAILVDVRTTQEWEQTGLPDLKNLSKDAVKLSWIFLPSGEKNNQFVSEISNLRLANETPMLFLCRSGGRSQAAAIALTQQGYSRCFNVAGGVEGTNGWKASGLPLK